MKKFWCWLFSGGNHSWKFIRHYYRCKWCGVRRCDYWRSDKYLAKNRMVVNDYLILPPNPDATTVSTSEIKENVTNGNTP